MAQRCALFALGDGWLVEDCVVERTNGSGISFRGDDVTIRRNICALNGRYQVGFWWDNPFFGPHPSAGRGLSGTPYDPDQNNIRLDKNLHRTQDRQAVALWGCPWRETHR